MADLWLRMVHPLRPLWQRVRGYRAEDLPRDLVAGLTVSVVGLPQAMAFALIAGVPPVYGLYTAIFLTFFGALFSSSRFLSVGPTNTQSLLIAAIVSRIADDPAVYLRLVIGLALIKGGIQLVLAAARMGQLFRFVSHSVVVGFTAGAGILIFAQQIPAFLGLRSAASVDRLPGVLDVVQRVLAHLEDANLHAVLIGFGSLVIVAGCQRISERLPGAFVAIGGSAFVVWMAGWRDTPVVGALPRELPGFRFAELTWLEAEQLLPGAAALAILGVLESVAIAKAIGQRAGQPISADREFFGQGLANLLGSFFQCIPGSGSFSRTALQVAAGARSRVASIVNALANASIFLALAPLAALIPLSSLAAILFLVAYGLVDTRSIWRIARTSRAEAAVCLVTLAATLLVPLTYAIYVGIFVSLSLYLRNASRLHLVELRLDNGQYEERPVRAFETQPGQAIFLQLQGDLFFGVADELAAKFRELVSSDVRVVILRLKRTHSIDATVLFTFEQFIKAMHAGGRHVIFCGVPPEVHRSLRAFGIEELVGKENIFGAAKGVFASAKMALERARVILAPRAQGE